ncbi:hypothetical protein EBQ25_03500 [Allofranklinella schreckenbergeri]|uniref:Uncharacterized protein n=1 Tax=Allofranklinella schreckenbergeri TaxID=1076744 RepID=A0A3M6QG85_9BURK|nr:MULTISPECIES: hypothetical protein [Comamonadaceae]RMX01731.1 hypothetical protein EBQ25_03500 [Allofranklinella schreckenbergeri]
MTSTESLNLTLLLANVLIALLGPLAAVHYLRPILVHVLRTLCEDGSAAEFWVRCAYLLALSGSLMLALAFGDFRASAAPAEALRHSLLLMCGGVFVSVALIARGVWRQVAALLEARRQAEALAHLCDPTPPIHAGEAL